MLGALYINKVHAEEAEEEEENQPSLEVDRGVTVQDLEHMFEVRTKQDEDLVRLRDLPEYAGKQGVLFPDDKAKSLWDAVMLMYVPPRLMAYTVSVTPYRVGFVDTDDWDWMMVELCINVLFFVDVLVNSVSAYYDSTDTLIVDRRKILIHYAETWMLIDLLSCIPFNLLFSDSASYGSLVRFSKLPRLYRILKLTK